MQTHELAVLGSLLAVWSSSFIALPAQAVRTERVLASDSGKASEQLLGPRVATPQQFGPSLEPTRWLKVVDTSTPVPQGSGMFAEFDVSPVLDQGNVCFAGRGDDGWGLYFHTGGGFEVVVAPGTAIPEGSGDFTLIFEPSLDGSDVSFGGLGDGQFGHYARIGGTLLRVADQTTPVSSAADGSAIRGGKVVFLGQETNVGVYAWEAGDTTLIADPNTLVPPAFDMSFQGFADGFGLGDGIVAFFSASPSLQGGGIYALVDGIGIVPLVDGSTELPNGIGLADHVFSSFSLDGDDLAFVAGSDLGLGAYVKRGMEIFLLSDTSMPVPGGDGLFVSFDNIAVADGDAVFFGLDEQDRWSLFAMRGFAGPAPAVERIAGPGDPFDGKVISEVYSNGDSLEAGRVVVFVEFSDGSTGIYLPEPQSGALASLTCLALLALARLRRPLRVADHREHLDR